MADRRKGPSLAVLTNQPAPAAAVDRGGQPSDIACILRENKLQYRVRYTQPEANPEELWVSKKRVDTQAEYIGIVRAWREQQQPVDLVGDSE